METKPKEKMTTNTVKKKDLFVELIGEFGNWQLLIFATIALVKLPSGWVQMAILFLTPTLTFRCENLPNATEEILNSTCYEGCLEYFYDTSPFDNTIVTEWNLICDRRWMASFTQTLLQLGILMGSAIFGFLSDRFGRKNTFLAATVLMIGLSLGVPFSPSYEVFTILRTLQGMATAGTMVVSFVIIMESIGPKYREVAGCLYQLPFITGHMTIPLFAYYFRSWNTYTLALGIPTIIYLGYFFVLTESPRWLVSVGRVEDATKIVTKIAIMNKKPITNIEETLRKFSQEVSSSASEPKRNYTDLFHPSLRLKTICSCTIWLISGVSFYGFNQYISQTSPNPFLSSALAGAIQIPANIASIWLIRILGRRITISLFAILGGLFVVILYFVPKTFGYTLTLGTLGVCCSSIVACSIYIYSSELYPTVVRNMGMGVCSTSMRAGSMAAPFISNATDVLPWFPTAVFGLAPIGGGLLCFLLPETKGRTFPDSLEDIID